MDTNCCILVKTSGEINERSLIFFKLRISVNKFSGVSFDYHNI